MFLESMSLVVLRIFLRASTKDDKSKHGNYNELHNTHLEEHFSTMCIVKTSGFTRCACKKGDFIKFEGFLVEFLVSTWSWESQKPPENRQESGLFWASPLQCT